MQGLSKPVEAAIGYKRIEFPPLERNGAAKNKICPLTDGAATQIYEVSFLNRSKIKAMATARELNRYTLARNWQWLKAFDSSGRAIGVLPLL